MTAAPSPTTRPVYPQCGDCRWAQRGPGCGLPHAGTPCKHPQERRRFAQTETDKTPGGEHQTKPDNCRG
jgi:hypothetical protein